jgi:uncharacterized coiled-coil protein SlyX
MEIENQGESSSSGDELELKKQAQLEKIKDFNFIVADVIQAIEKTNEEAENLAGTNRQVTFA